MNKLPPDGSNSWIEFILNDSHLNEFALDMAKQELQELRKNIQVIYKEPETYNPVEDLLYAENKSLREEVARSKDDSLILQKLRAEINDLYSFACLNSKQRRNRRRNKGRNRKGKR